MENLDFTGYFFLTSLLICIKVYGRFEMGWETVFIPLLYYVISMIIRKVMTVIWYVVSGIYDFFEDNELKRRITPDESRIIWDAKTKELYDNFGNIVKGSNIEE